MNKIKTYLAAGGCLLAMALTTACEDRLSALPSQSKVDDNLIVDQKKCRICAQWHLLHVCTVWYG